MPAPVFIGDELSASAYRLGGAETHVPLPEETAAVFERACAGAELVLITTECAGHLPAQELARAQAGLHPLVLVVPDVRDRHPLPDLSRWLRAQLGLDS